MTRKTPPPIVPTLLVLITITTQCKPLLGAEVPRSTAIERLQIGISEERYRGAAQAWVDTIAGGDFGVTKAAFEDLVFAPHEAQKRVLDQMENSAALVNLFNSLNRQNRQQLLDVLLPFGKSTLGFQNALAQELHSLSLSRDDLQYVSNICILLQSHGKLSDPVQAQLVASVTRASDPQVRQAIASVLIDKAQLLGSREADFRTWLQSRDPALHRLGLQLLLRTRATLSSDSVDEALRDATGELQSDALRYATSIPTQNIDQERLKIIAPWFDHPSSAEQWELSYRALAAKSPEILNAYFEKLGGRVTEWNKLKPEILVRILEVLPPTRDQALASWKLLQAGSQKELLSDESRVNLLILLRRARVGTDISADLFDSIQHIQGSDVASMKALAELVNQVLLARVQGIDDFGKFLLTKWQSSEFESFRDQI